MVDAVRTILHVPLNLPVAIMKSETKLISRFYFWDFSDFSDNSRRFECWQCDDAMRSLYVAFGDGDRPTCTSGMRSMKNAVQTQRQHYAPPTHANGFVRFAGDESINFHLSHVHTLSCQQSHIIQIIK